MDPLSISEAAVIAVSAIQREAWRMRMRVLIPTYSDAYLEGERAGEVVDTHLSLGAFHAKTGEKLTMARVKLDKSGKTRSFLLDDCATLTHEGD